jgi:hypothetical protein
MDPTLLRPPRCHLSRLQSGGGIADPTRRVGPFLLLTLPQPLPLVLPPPLVLLQARRMPAEVSTTTLRAKPVARPTIRM